jgi:hypothetical protein
VKLSFLCLFLLVPQLVFADTAQGLKHAIDEYTYAITVEWDQKDREFAKTAGAAFEAAVAQLLSEGLTSSDIQDVIGMDLQLIQARGVDLSNAQEVSNFLVTEKRYQQGASWNGEAAVFVVVSAIAILFTADIIVRIIKQNRTYDKCVIDNGGDASPCIRR